MEEIQMTHKQLKDDISKLELPEWQKKELEKRYKDFQAGKVGLRDWKSLHEGLRQLVAGGSGRLSAL